MMKTLFLKAPSYEGFDGGAGSRYQARREIKSFWFPTWLAQPAALIPGSTLIDAPPARKTLSDVVPLSKDFELAIRFQCVTGGNSGVFYRTSFKPGTADVAEGYQFEIDRNLNHHTGGIYTARRGWIVWPSPENEFVIKPTEWNDYVLSVVGNHHRARLNGVQVIDFTDPVNEVEDGAIALQLHAGGEANMRFKDVFIRDLSVR